MSTNYHQDLPQPYLNCDPDREMSRLSADITYKDKALIKLVCPKKGIFMQMTQIFFSRICEELRSQNITHYTPENEQRFLAIIVRLATPTTLGETAPRDVGTGTEGARPKPKRSVKQRSNPQTSDKQTKGGEDC